MIRLGLLIFTALTLFGCASAPKTNLYDDIGGKQTLHKVYGLAINRIYNDPVLGPHFEGVPKRHLRTELTNQTCELIGGPCEYEGKSMHEAHADRNVTDAEFFRLVEHVQQAMRLIGLTYEQENRILAALAPLKEQIVYQAD
ncbi:Group 1 truncated hemoglobin GlbN [Saliniradius amylolyticus]|uniref:Group 1 truncated hemoglobin GlbN n=1 Tax=Saliniradius amylolyticus TaxID=2183582 RepID=A0A2S2E526_9ALTE|nr:group 1 truncated hemoglobin [Saliniradius amylolyticus]AWL12755.1 Group 1 truncated hemoglobin GlbN [Saliniradius amylolyticus]